MEKANLLLNELNYYSKMIEQTVSLIAELAKHPNAWNIAKQITVFAIHLAEYQKKIEGFCYAISILGYRVEWEGEKPIAIIKL